MCRNHEARSAQQAIYDPKQCPFTSRKLNSTTWLIRENDQYGEYPHIYVKKYTLSDASVLVITDTGVGTDIPSTTETEGRWNNASFIQQHFGDLPILVILSHCHYDHILGLAPLLESKVQVQVLASSYDKSFTTPYENLQVHSLCASMNISAPKYDTAIWAGDDQHITYTHPSDVEMQLPIVTLHTPGHTPDSLTWYDTQERVLYVGDSFYDQISPDSDNAPWGPEGPAPILFPNEGSLVDWWCSLNTLLAFVATKNSDAEGERVKLAAGHVTSNADAGMFLIDVKGFVARILRNVLSFEERPAKRGERFGMWSESGGGRFSLGAPVRLVEEGREKIPRVEWRC